MTEEERADTQHGAPTTPAAEDAAGTGGEVPQDGAGSAPEGTKAENNAPREPTTEGSPDASNAGEAPADDPDAALMAALEDLPDESDRARPDEIDFGSPEVSKAEFQHLTAATSQTGSTNIELLMDVNLPISIELGRTKMSIADILSLGPGSVVELNKLAGEPVDVLVNYKIVAKGEVVVVDENFGVRITQLMTPEERLKLLSEEQ